MAVYRNMVCKTCDELLDSYGDAVKLYATAVRSCGGLLGDDLRLAVEKNDTPERGVHSCQRQPRPARVYYQPAWISSSQFIDYRPMMVVFALDSTAE